MTLFGIHAVGSNGRANTQKLNTNILTVLISMLVETSNIYACKTRLGVI